ncbi:MAG: hydrogenase maturation peptidase HycI [Candidatus Verstraetearchaeota archaeon]|nr:hydrogenase maturation peptidase HycI [Candidatus Verstraetearchaeota archaeon]
MGNINKAEEIFTGIYKFLEGFRKVVIMGIGNELRGDDAAGLKVIELLSKRISGYNDAHDLNSVILLNCSVIPENFLGKVETISPSHVIIIDAVEMQKQPGTIGLFRKGDLLHSATISTHNISPEILFTYLEEIVGAKVLLIGIQPKILDFYEGLSQEVCNSVELITDIVWRVITYEGAT